MAAKLTGGRAGFREWVDKKVDHDWNLMPLTHITKSINAEDIIRTEAITPTNDGIFEKPLAYFFYGRPAYRVSGDGSIRVEAACPFCFIFEPTLIDDAESIHAFDTGAFSKRMYKHVLMDEMSVEDFSLGKDSRRPNKIIGAIFNSRESYFNADTTRIGPTDQYAEPWEFHACAYLELLKSKGRNEPDDRVCSIEVVFSEPVPLRANLKAVVVPHTLWGLENNPPWIKALDDSGVCVTTYVFIPGRHPEYYLALLEESVRSIYKKWGLI